MIEFCVVFMFDVMLLGIGNYRWGGDIGILIL